MTDEERLIAERACERLVHAYTHLIDLGEAEKVAELFTPDGVWEGPHIRMEGTPEIRRGFRRRQQRNRMSRHICTNVIVDVADERTASGLTYFLLYRYDGTRDGPAPLDGPAMIGLYRDRFARTDAGWRFARRSSEVAFLREEE